MYYLLQPIILAGFNRSRWSFFFILVSENGCRLDCSTWRGGRGAREECATLAIDGGWGGGAVEEGGGGNRAPQHGLPLSLSLPLVRTLLHCGERWRTHSGLRPRVPRTHEALVAQLCLVLLIQYKVVWFFLPFPIKNMDKVSPVSSTVCIIKIYINRIQCNSSCYNPRLF